MKTFLKLVPILIVALSAFGCKKDDDAQANTAPIDAKRDGPPGVTPIGSGAAGPVTPMTGTESVAGSGSGIGGAAKDSAKRAASGASQPRTTDEGADDAVEGTVGEGG